MKTIRLATVFSGIGAPEWALRRLSIPYDCVLACDNGDIILGDSVYRDNIAKSKKFDCFDDAKRFVDAIYQENSRRTNFVKQSYLANYPDFDKKRYFLDIRFLDGRLLKNQVDLLIGGSPCQSFSTVGFQKGTKDPRGLLFYQFVRLVKEVRPKVFIYENVLGIRSNKNLENWNEMWKTMSNLGYQTWTGALNAVDFGIPQIRNRLFVVGFLDKKIDISSFKPKEKPTTLAMQDFLIDSTEFGGFSFDRNGDLSFSKVPGVIEEKYYLTPAVKKYVLTPGTKNFKTVIETDKKIARTLLSTMGNHHRAGVDNYVTTNGELRALSERECLRLMGFTDDFKIVVSKAQMYKQSGNAMVVDVIMALLKEILRFKPF